MNSDDARDIPQNGHGSPVAFRRMQELSSLKSPGKKCASKSSG
ncbi:MAG: hypothetical protein ABIY50_12170 [Ignavibacteria bacterium]